jgi:hypothetical protein
MTPALPPLERLPPAGCIPRSGGTGSSSRGPRRTSGRPPRVGEEAESYPGVVVVFEPGRRIIECSAQIQWILQVRQGPRWVSRSFCRTREAVLRLTASDHPALLAMPARFPEKVAAQ